MPKRWVLFCYVSMWLYVSHVMWALKTRKLRLFHQSWWFYVTFLLAIIKITHIKIQIKRRPIDLENLVWSLWTRIFYYRSTVLDFTIYHQSYILRSPCQREWCSGCLTTWFHVHLSSRPWKGHHTSLSSKRDILLFRGVGPHPSVSLSRLTVMTYK
jgi:hypothetical protein